MGKMRENAEIAEHSKRMLALMEMGRYITSCAESSYRKAQGLDPWIRELDLHERTNEELRNLVKGYYAELDRLTDEMLDECDTANMNRLIAHAWDIIMDMCHTALRALSDENSN